jgi:hypothetical protein
MNIITCTESIRKFLIILQLTLLLTRPQLNHLTSFISSGVQGGFNGKIINIPELSMRKIHRTSIGKFLSKSPWPTHLVLDSYQFYVIARIRKQVLETGSSICDSWYSSQSIIRASHKRGFHYIGALKTNRVLYTPGGSKLRNKVKVYAKTLTENDV